MNPVTVSLEIDGRVVASSVIAERGVSRVMLCGGHDLQQHGWEAMQYIKSYAKNCSVYACAQCGWNVLVRDDEAQDVAIDSRTVEPSKP